MDALVAVFLRQQFACDRDALKRRPCGDDAVFFHGEAVDQPPHKNVAADFKGQHTVGHGLGDALAGSRHAEPEMGRVGKLGIFLRHMYLVILMVHTGHIGHHVMGAALHQHLAAAQQFQRFQLRQRLDFCLPEWRIVGNHQKCKRFQRPVRRTGGVVAFGHVQVRVAVANGQDAAVVKNRLLHPPVQVTEQDALDLPGGKAV